MKQKNIVWGTHFLNLVWPILERHKGLNQIKNNSSRLIKRVIWPRNFSQNQSHTSSLNKNFPQKFKKKKKVDNDSVAVIPPSHPTVLY